MPAGIASDAEFATQGTRRLTYREALASTHQLAHAFVNFGLQIGDRIAVLSKNSIDFVLLYFAASKAGVVPVPLNYRLAPAEWRYIINDAGARMLLAEAGFLTAVDPIRPALPTVERFVALGDAGATGWDNYHPWVSAQPTTPQRGRSRRTRPSISSIPAARPATPRGPS